MTNPTLRAPTALQARILARASVEDRGHSSPCWISDRSPCGKGYTKIGVAGRTDMTHRVAYEAWRGPIPSGLVIDHLCRVRKCCNPSHLEAVTNRENLVRGDTLPAREAGQTHCLKGHPFDAANTYLRPDRLGRCCRTCRADANRRAKAARRQAETRPNT